MSDADKSNADSATTASSTAGPAFIRRNRFPKAQPNIAISSGMARIRRLSGHYSSSGQQPAATPAHPTPTEVTNQDLSANLTTNNNVDRTPPLTPVPQQQFNIQQSTASFLTKQLSDSPKLESKETKSPMKPSTPLPPHHHSIHDENLNSPSPLAASTASTSLNNHQPLHLAHASLSGSSVTARHYINLQNQLASYTHSSSSNHPSPLTNDHYLAKSVHLVAIPPSPAQPRTPTLFPITPCGSVYNPKFSSEHIMNIIKYKSLQKLKKIETESLKEKRKSYKKELLSSIAAASAAAAAAAATSSAIENEDSNSTSTSNDSKEKGTSGGLTTLNIDKSKLRMKDFLYYNPKIAKKTDPNEIIIETIADNQNITEATAIVNENENSVAESLASTSSSSLASNETNTTSKKDSQTTSTASSQFQMAAPQLKFAEDGSIIINEESLLIQREHVEPVYESTVVESEQNDNLTYNSYRKFHHTKKWTDRETAKFYKALSMIGTDFTMIQRLFSHRSRDEIKRKFKREEKLNQAFIDKVLSKTSQIDLSVFVSSGSEDDKQTNNKTEKHGKKSAKNKNETTETGQNEQGDAEESSTSKKKKTKLKRIKKREFIESESDSENVTGASDKQSGKRANNKKIDPLASSTSDNKETSQTKKPNKSIEFISSDNDTNERLVANQTQPLQEIIIPTAHSEAYCSQQITIEHLETQLVASSNTSININSQSIKENKHDVLDETKLMNTKPRVDDKDVDDEEDEEDGIELVFDMETNNIQEINSGRNETVIVDNQIVNTSLVSNQFEMLTMPSLETMCNTININPVEMSQQHVEEKVCLDGVEEDENDEDDDVIFDLDNNTYIKNNEVIRISDQEIRATSLSNQQETNDESSVNQAKSSSRIVITKIVKE